MVEPKVSACCDAEVQHLHDNEYDSSPVYYCCKCHKPCELKEVEPKEIIECSHCGGCGVRYPETESIEGIKCEWCDGKGCISSPKATCDGYDGDGIIGLDPIVEKADLQGRHGLNYALCPPCTPQPEPTGKCPRCNQYFTGNYLEHKKVCPTEKVDTGKELEREIEGILNRNIRLEYDARGEENCEIVGFEQAVSEIVQLFRKGG
jgi:hypothetical protein